MKKEQTGLSMPKMILIAVVIAVLGIGGGALGSLLTSEEAMAFISQPEKEEKITYTMVPYSEFLINLKPLAHNDKSFLRIEFTFSVVGEENSALLTEEEAKMRDAVISLLRKKTSETIFSETDGNLTIKQEVKDQLNQLLGESIIEEVFVTDMVMQ